MNGYTLCGLRLHEIYERNYTDSVTFTLDLIDPELKTNIVKLAAVDEY